MGKEKGATKANSIVRSAKVTSVSSLLGSKSSKAVKSLNSLPLNALRQGKEGKTGKRKAAIKEPTSEYRNPFAIITPSVLAAAEEEALCGRLVRFAIPLLFDCHNTSTNNKLILLDITWLQRC
jgi:hypothetical protein